MHPVAAFLIIVALAIVCAVAGVLILFGLGWALIAAAGCLVVPAILIRKGLTAGG